MKQSEQNNVAVITTLYRGDNLDWASEALDSLKQQSYSFERINVYLHLDGPLPEGHEKWVEERYDDFYKIVRSDVNVGIALGLNKLIDALESEEFVFRMDLDDLSMPNRFERQISYMRENENLDLIGTQAFEIDESGIIIYKRKFPIDSVKIRIALYKCNPILHPTYCVRRELYERGLRYEDLYLSEDLKFLFSVIEEGGNLGNHPEYLFEWRRTKDFYRRRNLRRAKVECGVYLRGLYRLNGFRLSLLWPIVRFFSRLMPMYFVKLAYQSNIRNKF